MTTCIVSIADTEEMARTLDRYLRCHFGSRIESYFMTYGRNLLSGSLLRQTDLFILELLRRDDIGYRAEGIFAAEKWVPIGKRVLIVSGAAKLAAAELSSYWDLATLESLHERVQRLLERPPVPVRDFVRLKGSFKEYCRPAVDHHRGYPSNRQ
jgi:hypothetical protein